MKKIYLTLVILAICFNTKATHIVGGEFQLKHIRQFDYTLMLNLYFDDVNGSPGAKDNLITASIFSKSTHTFIQSVTLPIHSEANVVYTKPECSTSQLITRKIIYAKDIELSSTIYNNPGGYYVVWERCCRNNSISNIINPMGTGNVFYLEFPAVVDAGIRLVNSSPEFFTISGDYACINKAFTFAFGASDPDGDELRYSLITPFAGNSDRISTTINPPLPAPYIPVNWISGYAANSAIAPGMAINAQSGVITVTPDKLGLFVFSALCQEVRNGVVIGQVRRDFQILVIDCPVNRSPQLFVKEKDKNTFYSNGDTIYVDLDNQRCFDGIVIDPDFGQKITMTISTVNFQLSDSLLVNPTLVNNSPNDSLRFDLCWPECQSSGLAEVPFIFEVIVSDDGCPQSQIDTMRITLIARKLPNNAPTLTTNLQGDSIQANASHLIDFSLTGTDIDNDSLCLTAVGRGFDLTAYGIDFKQIVAKGNLSGNFSWTPDCALLSDSLSEYLIDFIITEKRSCKNPQDTLTVKLTVVEKPIAFAEFLPANIFTPNNDGKNDVFKMPRLPEENCQYKFRQIDIYNRWGRRVFRSKKRDFEWDGGTASAGIYYYHIDFKSKEFKGTVTLRK